MGMILGGSMGKFLVPAVDWSDGADRGAWGTRIALSFTTVSGQLPVGYRFAGDPVA